MPYKDPEARAACKQRWAEANPGKVNAKTAKYYATKLQRTPAWADMDAIKFFYERCIPMQGKNISGLHVETNLQWLTMSENRAKCNRWSE